MNRAKVNTYNRDAILARLMSGFGVTVVIQGDACPRTNGKVVILPPLKADADEIDMVIHDFGVAHEPAHPTEGSFDTTRRAEGFLHDVWNCVEDVRVENSQELTKYPGLRRERAAFYEAFTKYSERLGCHSSLHAFSDVTLATHGAMIKLLVAARCEQLQVADTLKVSSLVESIYLRKLQKYVGQVAALKTVDEAYKLAQTIFVTLTGHKPDVNGLPDKDKPEGDNGGASAEDGKIDFTVPMPSISDKVKARLECSVGGYKLPTLRMAEVSKEDNADHAFETKQIASNGVKMLGAAGARMTRLFTVNSKPRLVRNRLDGHLDCRAVTEDHMDTRRELYTVRIKGGADKTAVSFLYDISGSMTGYRIEHTAEVIHGLAYYLNRAGIPFELNAFNSYVYTIKPWATAWTGDAFLGCNTGAGGGTSMAMGVNYAARSLMARPESKKVLVVLGDGSPVGGEQESTWCAQTVKRLRANGATVIGIGINCDLSRVFGADSVILDPGATMGEYLVKRLTEILNRKARV